MTVRVVGWADGNGRIWPIREHACLFGPGSPDAVVKLPAAIEALERIDDITDAMEFLVAYRQFVEDLKQLTTPADAGEEVK